MTDRGIAPDVLAPAIRLVLVDDHPLVLDGLRALASAEADLHVVATATDGERALDAVRRFRPDVAVMDLQMPHLDGIGCVRAIRAEGLATRVLLLSAYGDVPSLRAAVEAGAEGYALKTDSPQSTLRAIRAVADGQLVFPSAARRWLAGVSGSDPSSLTKREESILALLTAGRTNAQIATSTGLSENTVKFHLRNLFAKLQVSNRTEAVAKALKRQ